jgi:hypothetical protein
MVSFLMSVLILNITSVEEALREPVRADFSSGADPAGVEEDGSFGKKASIYLISVTHIFRDNPTIHPTLS